MFSCTNYKYKNLRNIKKKKKKIWIRKRMQKESRQELHLWMMTLKVGLISIYMMYIAQDLRKLQHQAHHIRVNNDSEVFGFKVVFLVSFNHVEGR